MRFPHFRILALSLLVAACGRTSRRDSVDASPGPGGDGARAGSTGGDAGSGARAGTSPGGNGGNGGRVVGGAGAGGSPELSFVGFQGEPIYTRVQRLTNRQWERAVTDVLRFERSHGLSASFVEPIAGATDFDNNEHVLFVDLKNVRDFELGAEAAAALATGSAEALAALYDGDDAEGFVRTLGRRAFRRPLTLDEEARYQEVFARGEAIYGPGFGNGAALVIRAMLQSPHFLYRTELGPAGSPLSGYEIAAKLSLWLLGTTPSDSLLDAASEGELDSEEGIEVAARRMLEEPAAVDVMRDFHAQLLRTRRYEQISKVGVPEYDPAINGELVLASHAFFDHVFRENLGLTEFLTSKQAFVGPGLAPLYGLDAPGDGLELRDVGPSRSGYFMQVPFLMAWSENEQSDPIFRGLHVQRMTCFPQGVPAAMFPPLPPLQSGQSNRERVSEFTTQCGGACHAQINHLGFALEAFDGLGRERATDNGQPIDTSGSYPFAEGVAQFADGNELMSIMSASPQVHTCYSKMVTAYALGRDMVERDRPVLESLGRVSLGHSLKEVVIALVRDPAFRTREEGLP